MCTVTNSLEMQCESYCVGPVPPACQSHLSHQIHHLIPHPLATLVHASCLPKPSQQIHHLVLIHICSNHRSWGGVAYIYIFIFIHVLFYLLINLCIKFI